MKNKDNQWVFNLAIVCIDKYSKHILETQGKEDNEQFLVDCKTAIRYLLKVKE